MLPIVFFAVVILIGALLLHGSEKNRVDSLSWTDSVFTATSAACVTGLVVVDTGSYFTTFGQTIILCLMQLGGLGILTFASPVRVPLATTRQYHGPYCGRPVPAPRHHIQPRKIPDTPCDLGIYRRTRRRAAVAYKGTRRVFPPFRPLSTPFPPSVMRGSHFFRTASWDGKATGQSTSFLSR